MTDKKAPYLFYGTFFVKSIECICISLSANLLKPVIENNFAILNSL